jgi:hypothetical protein
MFQKELQKQGLQKQNIKTMPPPPFFLPSLNCLKVSFEVEKKLIHRNILKQFPCINTVWLLSCNEVDKLIHLNISRKQKFPPKARKSTKNKSSHVLILAIAASNLETKHLIYTKSRLTESKSIPKKCVKR